MSRVYVNNKRSRNAYKPTGKPYTGEWYQPTGSHVTPYKEGNLPYPSDTECVCLIDTMPDYACKSCKGTGKLRFLSLYEKTLKRIGRANKYEGRDSTEWMDMCKAGNPDRGDIRMHILSVTNGSKRW